VDPFLNDDSKGKVIDLLIEHRIPVIVYTSPIDTVTLDEIIKKPIIDYVLKSQRNNFSLLINLLSQLLRHQHTAILIVDDSQVARLQLKSILTNLNLEIIEVDCAQDALKKIKERPEIKLILADYYMENATGVDLTTEVRKLYSNKEISIIGNSSLNNPMLCSDFLKNGANDFLSKPYQKEEVINRVLLQLDIIDYIQTVKDASEVDFLTGIYNRKYVYEVGHKLFDNAKRGNISLACAMIDIDHFKKVNDSYGHDVGDKVIIRLAKELSESFRKSDIVGRLGGEEFCVVLASSDRDTMEDIFNNFRKKIENIVMDGEDEDKNKFTLKFTISIGVTDTLGDSFEEMLKFADLKLYEAKNYGRNMVVI
jgi:diguanylate cyclase (GGDEF)-like protein